MAAYASDEWEAAGALLPQWARSGHRLGTLLAPERRPMSRDRIELQIRVIEVTFRSGRGDLEPLNMARVRARSRELLREVEGAARQHPDLLARLERLRAELDDDEL